MPVKRTVDQVIPKTESWPDGPSYHHHFMPAAPFGKGICSYGKSVFGTGETLEEEIFYSQLVQADTLRYIYGHYRANSPESSGVLLWQFNSAWPDGAWSIVDYYGRQKMACHFLREVCSPVCMHVKDDGWELKGNTSFNAGIFLTNQSWESLPESRLEVSLASDTGEEMVKVIPANSLGVDNVSDPVSIQIPLEDMHGEVLILDISWVVEGKVITSTSRWYARNDWRSMGRVAREFLHGCVVSQLPAEERPGVACKM